MQDYRSMDWNMCKSKLHIKLDVSSKVSLSNTDGNLALSSKYSVNACECLDNRHLYPQDTVAKNN